MNLSDSNMKSVPMIRPKYIFLAGWFLTSIFILLNCHYDWNILDSINFACYQVAKTAWIEMDPRTTSEYEGNRGRSYQCIGVLSCGVI